MKRKNKFSDWREDLIEVTGIPEQEPKTDNDSEKEITEKKIKNKITINPSMKEAFEEIGGTLLEVVELDEKFDMKNAPSIKDVKPAKKTAVKNYPGLGIAPTIKTEKFDIKKADMGDVIDDFYKSDAPQFKGKSKKKRREMAIAAKLEDEDNNGGGESMGEGMECAHNMKGKDCPVHGKKDCSSMKESMSVVDQMKASAKYWKENPRKDYKAGDGVKRNERDARANAVRKPKDTRTSQQRMNDAVGKSRAGESD